MTTSLFQGLQLGIGRDSGPVDGCREIFNVRESSPGSAAGTWHARDIREVYEFVGADRAGFAHA